MRKSFGKALSVSALMCLVSLVGTASARAAFVVFDVNETVVGGSGTITADDINGRYTEILLSDGSGGFTTEAYADFGQYFLATTLVPSDLNNTYGLYATFSSTGTIAAPVPLGFPFPAGTTLTTFTGTSGQASLFVDPNQDTGKSFDGSGNVVLTNTSDDYEILFTNTLVSGVGNFFDYTDNSLDGGRYVLNFSDVTITDPLGAAFLPTLANLSLSARVTGDFNNLNNPVSGDVDVQFTAAPVPEPATLTLLGIGLVGSGFARRRRGQPAKA